MEIVLIGVIILLERAVVTINDYGCVTIHLKEFLDSRNISRYALARSIGSRFEVVDKWYSGEVSKLDMDVLARICYVLDCSVSDILEYVSAPEKDADK